MVQNIILNALLRDLDLLALELKSYPSEDLLWRPLAGINNSPGNLALHLIGNLNHFFGAVLNESGYIRNREAEFSRKNVPLIELISSISDTKQTLESTFKKLKTEKLEKNYPVPFLGKNQPISLVIIQLSLHFNYHLGQINYHRRIVSATN
jgi:hypothetical protein